MNLKQIIRLNLEGISNREAGKILNISRNTVNDYINLFEASDSSFTALLELKEAELAELFSIKTTVNNERYDELMQFFEELKTAIHLPGFTFLYHYKDYQSKVDTPYGYTQFMEHYNRRHSRLKGSMKLEHKVGHEMMIDFAGKHLYITDKETGELIPVEVFVAILPFSHYTYVEACKSQKREDLLSCIANTLNFYGGVPKAIVTDNLKSAVSRASKYEPQINKSLKDFAHHYSCVINPTRAYSPQDKALVENAVKLTYQRIYHPMRNMIFFSLAELNTQIKICLEQYNNILFQRKEASRKELFQSIERSHLKSLPQSKYEMKDYRRAKVQNIGYVYFSPDKNYYSVPYRYIGKQVQIHSTKRWIEVFFNNTRIAMHERNPDKGIYTTNKAHLSSTHQAYQNWSPEYFKTLAKKHGESVMMLVDALIHRHDYPETAYKGAMGIIQLHQKYGSNRLNNACQRAFFANAISYGNVKNILMNNRDKEHLLINELNKKKSHIPAHENTRGASNYQ
jgi:transposase